MLAYFQKKLPSIKLYSLIYNILDAFELLCINMIVILFVIIIEQFNTSKNFPEDSLNLLNLYLAINMF